MDIIAAVTSDWGLGKSGKLLFSIPDDMRFFREKTANCAVIMGKNTLLSFPNGKPLKGRVNIVLSRDESFSPDGVIMARSISDIPGILRGLEDRRVFVIGGGSIYRQLLPFCEKAYITKMDTLIPADTYFPDLDSEKSWRLADVGEEREYSGVKYRFCVYENLDTESVIK